MVLLEIQVRWSSFADDNSKPEILSRISQATAALTKVELIWRDYNISLGSKVKLMRSLFISIYFCLPVNQEL